MTMPSVIRKLWKYSAAAIAAVVIVMATVVGFFRLGVPLVPQYRTDVERWAEKVIGWPVTIGRMDAKWSGLGPEITLGQVRMWDHTHGRVVMQARRVNLIFNLFALIRHFTYTPNRIELLHPRIALERETDGSIHVLGLIKTPASPPTDWRQVLTTVLSRNAEVDVEEGEVIFRDRSVDVGPWQFSNIGLKLGVTPGEYVLSGKMNLPAALGNLFSFSINAQGAVDNVSGWHWHLGLDTRSLRMAGLARYTPDGYIHFASGTLDLNADLTGKGKALENANARLTARELVRAASKAGSAVPKSSFSLISGDFHWEENTSGWQFHGKRVQLARAGTLWPPVNLSVAKLRNTGGEEQWQAEAGFLRLQDLALLRNWLPVDFLPGQKVIQALAPQGDIASLKASVSTKAGAVEKYSLGGRFTQLGIRPYAKIPGFNGLSGTLAIDSQGGTIHIDAHDVGTQFPWLFRKPLQLDRLQGEFKLVHDNNGWRITGDAVKLANQDAQAEAQASLQLPAAGGSPVLDLTASVRDSVLTHKSLYFPAGIMPASVVKWLDDSIVSGRVPDGKMVFHGPTKDFPFADGKGVFDIRFHLLDGVLDYAAGWPGVRKLDADVVFHNQGLTVTTRSGEIAGTAIRTGSKAEFADLANGTLKINGGTESTVADTFRFLKHSPLIKRFGPYLSELHGSGKAPVDLHLTLPVTALDNFQLKGTAHLENTQVVFNGLPYKLSKLNGALGFTQDGLTGKNISGEFLNMPVKIEARRAKTGKDTLLIARGTANSTSLAKSLGLAAPKWITGKTPWWVTARLPSKPGGHTGRFSITMESGLKGLHIRLPAPLGKAAEASVASKAVLLFPASNQMQLIAHYGNRAAAKLNFRQTGPGKWHLASSDLHLGSGSPETVKQTGRLYITGKLSRFVLADWQSSAVGKKPGIPAFVSGVNLTLGQFEGYGQSIENLHIQIEPIRQGAVFQLDSQQLAGRIEVPDHPTMERPVVADMQRLRLKMSANSSPAKQMDPRDLPAIHVNSKDFRFDDMQFGELALVLEPMQTGIKLQSLKTNAPSFESEATGQWLVDPEHRQVTHLSAKLTSSDVQKTLHSLGFEPGLSGNKGEVDGELDWRGNPGPGLLKRLTGKLHLKVEDGQLADVQPGAGRLFGLFSLTALPRRLTLDFSDVFKKGLGFDSIEGDFLLTGGSAYTSDLQIKAPAANIKILGRTGLAAHDYDQVVIVSPHIGASLPLIGTAASGPVVGALLLVLSELFKKPIEAVGQARYRITGSWSNPHIEALKASPAAPDKKAARQQKDTHSGGIR